MTVKILNIGIDVEINWAYLKLDFFIALSVQPGLTSLYFYNFMARWYMSFVEMHFVINEK